MSSNGDDLPISFERGFGRTLQAPKQFFDQVGDFVVNGFEGLPTGQAVAAERSLLQPYAPSTRSDYQSFPTVGMSAFIELAADQQQIPVDVPTYRVRPLAPPVRTPSVRNPAIPQFVYDNAEGIIEYDGDVSAAEIIIDISSAYPTSHVLVVSTHQKELQRLYSRVRKLDPSLSAIDVSGGGVPYRFGADDESISSHQLVFSTILQASSLGETVGRDIAQFSIVIYTQATRAVDLMRQGLVFACDSAFRLFAFHSLKSPMAEDANRYATQVCGGRRLQIPQSGFECSGMSLCRIVNDQRIENLRTNESGFIKRMQQLLTCPTRNRHIARVARCLASGQSGRLENEQLQRWIDANHHEHPPTVAVICRTYQQAATLAKPLSGWNVFQPDDSPDILSCLESSQRKRIERVACKEPLGNRVIVPVGHLSRYLSVADPECLIIASGGPHAPAFPKHWSRHPAGTSRRRLVVDFTDEGNRVTRQHSKLRAAEYYAQRILDLKDFRTPEEGLQLRDAVKFYQSAFRPCRQKGSHK
jgi:hypothetical protein